MMNCIVIEDQGPAQEILEQFIAQTDSIHLIGVFPDVLNARDFMINHPVDLIFLDINLPKMSGMEYLRNETALPQTILTTAYSEFALECYEYNVVDYLLKPYSFERFSKAIAKVNQSNKGTPAATGVSQNNIIYAKSGTELIQVNTQDILFIKADGDYTEIFTKDEKHLTSHSLKEWIEKLSDAFIQVHRSYIVHLTFVQKVNNNKIHISSEQIPVGRSFKKNLMGKLGNS